MDVQPEFRSDAIWMTIGSDVTLLPVEVQSGLLAGEVTHWLGGSAGVIATIGVRTTADVAAVCAGQRLWLSGHAALTGELIVLEVIAREASRHVGTSLTLTGVLPLARERRRDSVRATTRHPVLSAVLNRPDDAEALLDAGARLLDIGGGGRLKALAVRMPPIATILPSEQVLTASREAEIRAEQAGLGRAVAQGGGWLDGARAASGHPNRLAGCRG